jgi:PAS domain S-box-containing protein
MRRRTRANAIFLTALALLIASGIATYSSFSYLRTSERWVSHTQEVRASVGELEAIVNSAARSRLSFLISGREPDLNEFHAAEGRIPEAVARLRKLLNDNPAQLENCAALEASLNGRIQAWEASIRGKQQNQPIDIQHFMEQNLRLATQTSNIADAIRAGEDRLLHRRTAVAEHDFHVALITVVAALLLGILLLSVHYLLLTSELRARDEAEATVQAALARESMLRHEQERFRLFVEAVKDYAIYMLDPQGRIASWNQGAERIKGYTAAEIIGKNFSCFFTEPDLRDGEPQRELELASAHGQFQGEAWRVRKDGTRFWANVVLTAIKDKDNAVVGYAKVTRDVTEKMRAEESLYAANAELEAEVAEREIAQQKLAVSEASLRELSLHLLRSQDEERRRIGRELHDSLGQYLAMLKLNLESLAMSAGENHDGSGAQLAQCIRLAEESIKEMRTISYLLYPPMLEEVGLKSAILWYLEGFSSRSEIQTTLEVDPAVGRLPRDVELALFRVLQESLTNVHRHSGSSVANISLSRRDRQVILEIKDHGKGIPRELLEESGQDWLGSLGVGLRGMNERMRQLGGRLEISSNESGTLVTASVPVTDVVTSGAEVGR